MNKKFLTLLATVPLLAGCGAKSVYGSTLSYVGVHSDIDVVDTSYNKTARALLSENLDKINWKYTSVGESIFIFEDHSSVDKIVAKMYEFAKEGFDKACSTISFAFAAKEEKKCVVTNNNSKVTLTVNPPAEAPDTEDIFNLLNAEGNTTYTLYSNKIDGKISYNAAYHGGTGMIEYFKYTFRFPWAVPDSHPYSDFNVQYTAEFSVVK